MRSYAITTRDSNLRLAYKMLIRGRGSLAHSTIGHVAIAHRVIRHIKLRTDQLDTILLRTVRLETVLLRTVRLDTVAFGHNTYTCIYASKELKIFVNLLLN